jgi:hypothetical protein
LDHGFQNLLVQAQIGNQVLQTPVLLFELAQSLRFADLQPAMRFKIPTICSSLNRPLFIPFLLFLEVLTDFGPSSGAQVAQPLSTYNFSSAGGPFDAS